MKLNQDFAPQLKQLNDVLGSDFAIISHIKNDDYEVVEVVSEMPTVKRGDHFATANTYCNEVIQTNKPVIYEHVGTIKSMILHPIYTAMQLEAYLGLPLRVNGEIVGTLNFSGFSPKLMGFSAEEVAAAEQLAAAITQAIEPDSL